MKDIYLLTWFEHPLSMSGRGSVTIKGYTEDLEKAKEFSNQDGGGYGDYKYETVKHITQK